MKTISRVLCFVITLLTLAMSGARADLYNFNMMSATPSPMFDALGLFYPVTPLGGAFGVECVVFDDLDGEGGAIDGCANNDGELYYIFPDGILDGVFSLELNGVGDAIVGTPYAIGYRDGVATERITGLRAIPEPATGLLLGAVATTLLWQRRRRR